MKYLSILVISILLIGCSNDSDSSASEQSTGKGGSLARFTILGDYLYTVDENNLNVFSISDSNNPVFLNEVFIGFRIETLFAYNNVLFVGSQNGMFIYSLENPEVPKKEAAVEHFTSCDPVVSDGEFAYVSLHSNSICGNNTNVLEIYNVSDIQNPVLIEQRNMISPKGLGLYNDYLILCDDEVKIFNVSDAGNMTFSKSIDISGFDVIIQNNHLIVVGKNSLSQYTLDPTNIENITHLSTMNY